MPKKQAPKTTKKQGSKEQKNIKQQIPKTKRGQKQTSMLNFFKQKIEEKHDNSKQESEDEDQIKSESMQETEEEEQENSNQQQQEETDSQNEQEENDDEDENNNDDEEDDEEEEVQEKKQKQIKSKKVTKAITKKTKKKTKGKKKDDKKKTKRKAAQNLQSYKQTHKFGKIDDIEMDEDVEQIDNEGQDNNNNKNQIQEEDGDDMQVDEEEILEKLPRNRRALQQMLQKVEERLELYKEQFFREEFEGQQKKSNVDDNSIPICSDIRKFDFQHLRDAQMRHAGKMFDVIMMDPPWQLSSSQPSRGVAIAYDSLVDDSIQQMPIETLQTNGYIFIWAINAKYRISVKMMEKWGYKLVDEISWVKKTVNGKIAKGHGFYLQHAKESCLIGYKGDISSDRFKKNISSDVIFSERRGQSQKPTEIYEYAEQLVPNGFYLEIFGRRNNLRGGWVTIGNEL